VGAADPSTAYDAAFRAFAGSGAYDVLALVHDFPYRSLPSEVETALEVVEPLLRATADRDDLIPVFVSLTSGEPTPEIVEALARAGGVPVLRGTVEAFGAIAAVAGWEADQARRLAGGPVRDAWPVLAADPPLHAHDLAPDRPPTPPVVRALPERESLARLARAGLPVATPTLVMTPDEAAEAGRRIGFPVVLKVDATGLGHKSDLGAVRLDLRDPAAVRTAAAELLGLLLPAGAIRRGLLVDRQRTGVELVVGGRRDPSFGPIVLVGLGGILAEAFDDVAVRLAPVDVATAADMLDALRGRAILDGVRGRPGIDRKAVTDAIVLIGRLLAADPSIVEVDLNPILSGPDGTVAVDALVVEVVG
jgi:acyl-CoA synthetase (NDP forming)